MLKYKFRLHNEINAINEIECIHLYMSPDLTFVSGITEDLELADGETVFIKQDGTELYSEYPIQLSTVSERGYVSFMQEYTINEYDYYGNKFKGVLFADGKKYITDSDNLTITSMFVDNETNTFEINNISGVNTVKIPTRYYSYDGFITIGGIDYSVDFDDDKPHITLKDDTICYLADYNKTISIEDNGNVITETVPNVKTVKRFIIRKNYDFSLNVQHVTFTQKFQYILYPNNAQNSNVKALYLDYRYENGVKNYFLYDSITNEQYELENGYNEDESINTLIFKGVEYEINTMWRNTTSGNFIHLYLGEDNSTIREGSIINVIPQNTSNNYLEVYTENNKHYVILNGIKIYGEANYKQYLKYDNNELEIIPKKYNVYGLNQNLTMTELNYVMVDESPMVINISEKDGKKIAKRVYQSNEMSLAVKDTEYEVIERKYFLINGQVYPIMEHVKILYEDNASVEKRYDVIYYDNTSPIRLTVTNITGSNQIRCRLSGTDTDDIVLSGIVNAPQNYSYELENKLFDETFVSNAPTNLLSYITEPYNIYKNVSKLTIPITLSNNNDRKLHHEFVNEVYFTDAEIKDSINRIVDMERDIYYPATYIDNKFIEVNQIIFDLHFRSRDLNTWKINDDVYGNMTSWSDMAKCNWNILDYYNHNVNDTSSLKPFIDFNEHKYYQPSDLLYFLNFSDNDVFYQKSKIGKSFIRLLFYDSNDPRTQNLIYMSTIFINEGKLYKKYITNKNGNDGAYINVDDVDNINKRLVDNTIGVNFEPIKEKNRLTYSDDLLVLEDDVPLTEYPLSMDEEKRLSIQTNVVDMFNCDDSSEGFYLYLFKEYSSGIHEKIIYLKIEFNHAGTGNIVSFIQPYKINENGNKTMLDFSDESDINLLKQGCKLQELYNFMFIEVKVKYDFETKKFYYYLPNWLTEHIEDKSKMRFNLYELKLANES